MILNIHIKQICSGFCLATGLLFADYSQAQQTGSEIACPGPSIAPYSAAVPDRAAAPMTVEAYAFDGIKDGKAQARGRVEFNRADQKLETDILNFNSITQVVSSPGPLIYQDSMLRMEGDNARFGLLEQNGELSNVRFNLTGSSAQGSAELVEVYTGNQSMLRQLNFTTCAGERPDWEIRAKELNLDFAQGVGTARGATMRFLDVPFIYLPWMTFPIDDRRKSGFLYPKISNANDNGVEFTAPWYWNIAPNQDATLEPRYFTDRGFMLTAEYRMMTKRSGLKLNFNYMPSDKQASGDRYYYLLDQSVAINSRWHSSIHVSRVSDDQYFQDFGSSLASTSQQYLHSYAGVDGGGRYWTFNFLADDFQVIDEAVGEAQEPYRRLPRLAFTLDRPIGDPSLLFALNSELVNFDRDIGVTGTRLDLYPKFVWDLGKNWGFMRASAGYRYTAYRLDNTQLADDSPDRGTPILSLDTGLFFDRTSKNGNMQTLEPRLFYLNVPYENQDHLPDFDTAPFTFGFSQLFHYNRYTGADRQADANQLTIAATTRMIDAQTGRDRWSISAGQIIYF